MFVLQFVRERRYEWRVKARFLDDLVYCSADNPNTFRFASTAPFYVEIGAVKTSVSRKSCEFFQNWAEERLASLQEMLIREQERREVLPHHESAVEFWTQRGRRANTD